MPRPISGQESVKALGLFDIPGLIGSENGGDEVRSIPDVCENNNVKSDTCKIPASQNVLQCVLQNLIVTFRVTMTRNPLSRYPEMSNPPPLRKGRAT